jgi:hypothetical protein
MRDVGDLLGLFSSLDVIVRFVVLLLPGFVALAVFDLRIPGERRKFGEMGVALVVYSLLCDGVGLLYVWITGVKPADPHTPLWQFAWFTLVVGILVPGAIGWFVVDLREFLSARGFALDPMPKAWDAYFKRLSKSDVPLLLVVTLSDGRRVGGVWDKFAFTSTFPADEDLFIGTVCQLDQATGQLEGVIADHQGILLKRADVLAIEARTLIVPVQVDAPGPTAQVEGQTHG